MRLMVVVPTRSGGIGFGRPTQMLCPLDMRIGEDHAGTAGMPLGDYRIEPASCHHRCGSDNVQTYRRRELQIPKGDHICWNFQCRGIDEVVLPKAETKILQGVIDLGTAASIV